MPAYFNIDLTYDPQPMVDLYNSTNTNFKAVLPEGISTSTIFDSYFDRVTTAIVPRDDRSIEIRELRIGDSFPTVNTNNNGFVIFPITEAGKAVLNTYSYPPNTDPDGRPTLEGISSDAIVATLTTSTSISSPMVVDGLSTYSISVAEPHYPLPIILILKISKDVSWDNVYNTLKV